MANKLVTIDESLLTEWSATMAQQAVEIERLRFALSGCLIASKQDKPIFYSSALAIIQRGAHEALYGSKADMDEIKRPVATEAK